MEFENLQIEVPLEDEAESQYYGVKVYEKKYANNSKDFVVGFNPNSKEFLERKARRAKRFGLKETNREEVTVETDLDLFKDIDLLKLDWPAVPGEALEEMRGDAILLYGVNDMSTKDVFEYFKLFGPENLEWIDDMSCNVVWDDQHSMIRALDGMSKTYAALKQYRDSKKSSNAEGNTTTPLPAAVVIKEEEDENASFIDNAIPIEDDIDPKDVWRIGLPFKTNRLFLRPTTIKDKKLPGAAKRSEYYLKYGKNPNNAKRTPGVLSKSRKRKLEQMKRLADERFKNKVPEVKICDLNELKTEGLVCKMEVDEDEPSVKRPSNVHSNPMTMMADHVELGERLGYPGETVHDRLGSSTVHRRNANVHDRLGSSIRNRLGIRSNESDARHEIQSSRNRNLNHHKNNRHGFEDEHGIYHDIYRADEIKEEAEGIKPSIENYDDYDDYEEDNDNDHESNSYRSKHRSERFDRTSNNGTSNQILNRLPSPTTDLRNKLRRKDRNKRREDVADKVNLCIEIKQEPYDIVDLQITDDANFEF